MEPKASNSTDKSQLIYQKQALSCLSNYVYWVDHEGRIMGHNKKILKLFGDKHKRTLIGKTYQDLSHELKWLTNTFNTLKSFDNKVINNNKTYKHKLSFPSKKNTSLSKTILSCTHQPLHEKKAIVGIIIELVDITKSTHAEKRLRKKLLNAEKEIKVNALHMDRILAHLPCNVFWVDKNSANLGCNDNVATSLGFNSREEVKGLTYFDMAKIRGWPKEQPERWRKNDLQVMRTGKLNEDLNYGTNAKGQMVYQMTTRVPFRDDAGKILGVIAIATDITDRIKKEQELVKAKEKAEIANQAKSDFLATVSHELRTPLNGIIGMADILMRKNLSNDKRMLVADIVNSGKSLLSLINGILDLSKLEAGELEIINTPFDLPTVVRNVITQVSTLAKEKNIALSTKFDGVFPTRLLGDSQRLYQILINIVGNAVKFTNKGKIDLIIKCLDKSKKNCTLSFIIRDTGIGIPKNQINIIFDRFRQLDQSIGRKYSGTGLGLAIVKQLVELMHGDIKVESKFNKGTTFTVTLSFVAQPEKSNTNLWMKKHPNIRILIVENDLTIGTKILKMIHTPSISLVSSSNALDILENAAARNQHFQILLISDKLLNQESELLNKLKKSLPHFHFPMAVSYYEKNQKPNKFPDLLFDSINISGFDKKIITQLSSLWEKYELRLSDLTSGFATTNPKILLVEDNLINQRVTSHLLNELGCSFDIADNGILAIKLYKKNAYDLILMDVGLPDMDGYTVTQKIRSLEKKDKHIPIVALTAYASENDRQKCLNSGMDNVLTKPINRTGLMNMLSAWLITT